jgi:hypothetical protein
MSGANGTGLTGVEHWAFQVDSPFRSPVEIQALVGAEEALAETDQALAETDEASAESDQAYAETEAGQSFDQAEFDQALEAGFAEAEEWEEQQGVDLLAETPPSEHPLAKIFTLPRLAFDAMAKGGWQTAIGIAIGAGNRDVNRLTNMVFWFRHPQLIGQKLDPAQRDLVREWLEIRDRIVRPALAGRSPSTPVSLPSQTQGRPRVMIDGKKAISPDSLEWWGGGPASPELLDFMRRVYRLHVLRSEDSFVDTLPESAIAEIEGKQYARKDAAGRAREMLAAARAALAAEGLAGRVRIGILSGYRSADRQFDIWQGKTTKGKGGFPHYYHETSGARTSFGDEHGDRAAAHLAQYLAQYVAAPGYSNHQDGLALDLGVGAVGGPLRRLKKSPKSWFWNWLKKNASDFQFGPYAKEAWHWIFKPSPGGSASETWETLEARQDPEAWASEAGSPAIPAGRLNLHRIPLLRSHTGQGPDIVLRWNDMPAVPPEIDVVVHLHGFSRPSMTLPKDIEIWSGLDLAPIKGATGSGRSRPTLTVLPRGHNTGVRRGRINKYTFPALVTRDGLTKLVKLSLERFAGQVGGTPPKVGRLILTAHSGGGAALLRILRQQDPQEVHVFDGLYQDPTSLAEWAIRHIRSDRAAVQAGSPPTGALRVFYRPGTRNYSIRLLDAISAELRSAPSSLRDLYRVEASTLGHWQIPRQYGWRVLADAAADVPDARRPTSREGAAVKKLFESESGFQQGLDSQDESEAGEGTEEAWELQEAADEAEAELEDLSTAWGPEAEVEAFDTLEEEGLEQEGLDEEGLEEEEPEAEAFQSSAFPAQELWETAATSVGGEAGEEETFEAEEFARHGDFEALEVGTDGEVPSASELQGEAVAPTSGAESMAVRAMLAVGMRDENRLTNMLFHTRHPELGGRAIRSDERAFAREWVDIRDGLVRPLLRAASPTRSAQTAAGSSGAATRGRPRLMSTSALRRAWAAYECREGEMVTTPLLGWRTPVNPRTVDAWRALEEALLRTGYRAKKAWVYNCRNIAGQSTRSLHAFGLALDIDAKCNPNRRTPDKRLVRFSQATTQEERCADVRRGTADTIFMPAQIEAVEAIRTADGHQVFAWGGRWQTTKDTMHFQINVTPDQLVRGLVGATREAA